MIPLVRKYHANIRKKNAKQTHLSIINPLATIVPESQPIGQQWVKKIKSICHSRSFCEKKIVPQIREAFKNYLADFFR